MTELTFLIDLLLNHDLPKETKASVASRIKEVEEALQPKIPTSPIQLQVRDGHGSAVAAPHVMPEPIPMVPQTQAAVNALAAREMAINQAMNHNRPVDPITGRPRKF